MKLNPEIAQVSMFMSLLQGSNEYEFINEKGSFNQSDYFSSRLFNKSIKSASAYTIDIPWGCIMHFSETCYSGKNTLLCNSIPDLTKSDFVFTKGSLYATNQQILNLIFFDDIKYTGNGYGIKGGEFTNLNDPTLIGMMQRAKSVLINVRDPASKYDPSW